MEEKKCLSCGQALEMANESMKCQECQGTLSCDNHGCQCSCGNDEKSQNCCGSC